MQQYIYKNLDRIVRGTVHCLIRLDIFQGGTYICLRFRHLSIYRTYVVRNLNTQVHKSHFELTVSMGTMW